MLLVQQGQYKGIRLKPSLEKKGWAYALRMISAAVIWVKGLSKRRLHNGFPGNLVHTRKHGIVDHRYPQWPIINSLFILNQQNFGN
jgi:hypothetical protein